MRRTRCLLLIGLLGAGSGCGGFVDLEAFDQLPALDDLDFSRVTPAAGTIMWQLRDVRAYDPPPGYTVVGGGGEDARDSLPADLVSRFDSVMVEFGFLPHCPPGLCFYYVAALDAGGIRSWTTPEEMATFLGAVNTAEEAALLVLAHGYSWTGTDRQQGAVRVVPEGFELVVTRLVSGCAPVQVNRYRLQVTTAAALLVLDEEVWAKDDGLCF